MNEENLQQRFLIFISTFFILPSAPEK